MTVESPLELTFFKVCVIGKWKYLPIRLTVIFFTVLLHGDFHLSLSGLAVRVTIYR